LSAQTPAAIFAVAMPPVRHAVLFEKIREERSEDRYFGESAHDDG
jgi:hypothetical protein